MADQEELSLVLRTVAQTQGANQTRDALRQVRQEAQQTQQALTGQQQLANTALRQSAAQGGVTASNLQSIAEQIKKQVGAAPTLTAAQLGIGGVKPAGATQPVVTTQPTATDVLYAQNLTRRLTTAVVPGAVAQQQRAERDARLEGREFSRINTGQTVKPFADAAAATKDISEGFKLSESSAVRFGAALVGVGLGLSVAAGAARLIHDQIASVVDVEIGFERASRSVTAILRDQSAVAVTASRAFTADPSTRGTAQEFLQTVAALHSLTQEYGLTQQQALQLATASGQLARIHGVELPVAARAVQAAMQGNTEALSQFGISLVDSVGHIRGVGASYQELVDISGRTRADQILFQNVLKGVTDQQSATITKTDTLADALDRLGKAAQLARERAGQNIAPIAVPAINAVEQLFNPPGFTKEEIQQKRAGLAGILPSGRGVETDTGRILSAEETTARLQNLNAEAARGAAAALEQERADLLGVGSAMQASSAAIQTQLTAYEQYRIALNRTLETLQQIGQQQSQLATIGQALRGPDVGAVSQADLARIGQLQAAEDTLAQRSQNEARQRAQSFREGLVRNIQTAREIGPVATARAEQDLAAFDRRVSARTAQNQAQQAGTLAQRAQANAQAQLTGLSLQQQQRQLGAAQSLANLRLETLGREGDIVDLQRQQADLADRITIAGRNNLDLVRQQAQARLQSLPSSEALNDNNFEQRRLLLRIQAIRSDVRRGVLDPSALGDIPAMRQQIRDLMREAPRLESNALEAARPGELLQRQAEREQLNQTIKLSVLQDQQRVLEDQLIPLQEAQRLTDERTAAIRRQLEIQQLGDTAARSAAEQGLITATAAATVADLAVRRAQDWAAGISGGLTDIERAWQLLATLPQPSLNPPVPPGGLVNPDRPHAPPPQTVTPGPRSNTNNIYMTFTAPVNDPNEVARRVLEALNNAVDRAPQASPVSLAGAIG